MTADVIPVTFPNREGNRLFGMLHRPAQATPGAPAILLLSPGVKTRVAPHRLYKKMADAFAANGFTVLRFDFHGLGDSEGEVQEAMLADLYNSIQLGRYVDDTIAAMNWMQREHGTAAFVAAGLCGGAITGLLAASRDPRIVSLLALAIPVTLDGTGRDTSKFMTTGELSGIRDLYLRKMSPLNPAAWQALWRFVTFRTEYSLLLRAVAKPMLARWRPARAVGGSEATPDDNTNPLFRPAALRMLEASRPILFVFAGLDRLHWEFDAKFVERHRDEMEPFARTYDIHVTDMANHIFSLPEWQRDMLDRSCRWLNANFPARPALAAR